MNERKVDVYLDDCLVGTLAETADRRVAFAYSDAWLESGFAISPFSLPVEQKVFVPSSRTFHGLWGVFADSLPTHGADCSWIVCCKAVGFPLQT